MKAIQQALQMTVDPMVSPRVPHLDQDLGDLDPGLGAVHNITKKKKEDEVLRSPLQASIAKVNFLLRIIAGWTNSSSFLKISNAKVAQWQSSLPASNTLPSCYGSLPTSPSPSPPPQDAPSPQIHGFHYHR